MTADDERIAAIEGWHPTSATADPLAVCVYHGAKCDSRWLLARLREAERERDAANGEATFWKLAVREHDVLAVNAAADRRAFGISSKNLLAERDAAREDAKALAEALRHVINDHWAGGVLLADLDDALAALAAHDGAAT